ncbi:MAG: carboxymuconolactone decarboxylase family protein [Bacteroidota bacterium]
MSIKHEEPVVYKVLEEADSQIENFNLDPKLVELIRLRASQINGCGYCVNYHSKNATSLGETAQRLFAVSAWWETPFFTEEERAALKLVEEVTSISDHGVSDEVFNNALRIFGKQKLAQLIFVITAINSWNRIAISTHLVAEKD